MGVAALVTHYAIKPMQVTRDTIERYGVLTSTPNTDVARAIVASGIQGCGEYHWQSLLNRGGEIRVYCSADGEQYIGYRVRAGSERMERDYSTMDIATQDALYPRSRIR